jgi:hypothetical protein
MLNSRKNRTVWGNPNSQLQSQFGYVSYAKWCELEAARMNRNGAKVKVVWDQGLVCIQNDL